MKNIKIPKEGIFSDIERLYSKIEPDIEYKVQLPNTLSHAGAFGLEGACLQLFCTIMRNSSYLTVHTYVHSLHDGEDYTDICNSVLGLCALRLSDRIFNSKKEEVSIKVALSPSVPIFKSLRSEAYKNAFKGPYLALPSVKSPAREGAVSRELRSPFYNNERLVNAEKFLNITKKSISAIYSGKKINEIVESRQVSNLSEIVRELFTNTHRHARTDSRGNYYERNVRAVTYKIDSLNRARMQEIARSGGGKLTKFIGMWLPKGEEYFYALDLTVIDAGPGFARRWTGLEKEQISKDAEKKAVLSCFKKNSSSAKDASSGAGLSNVLKDLKRLNGWMRLRTGRTLIEKTFFNYEGVAEIGESDIRMMEEYVEGTTFNVIIPIDSLKEVV